MAWSHWLLILLYICTISARKGFPISILALKSRDGSKRDADSKLTVPIGLHNLANTCYMNSIVQSLYNTELFNRLSDASLVRGSAGWHLKSLYDQMSKRDMTMPDTRPLARSMGVNVNIQEDAEEFLLKLLDKLASSVSDKRTLVRDMFDFEVVQTIDCTNVNHSSSRKQKYTDISVDIGDIKTTLHECLSNYFKPELLNGDNLYKTSSHGYQEAIKSIGLSSTPDELIIHLKRFSYDIDSNNYAKVR